MFFPKKQALNSFFQKLAFFWHLSVLVVSVWNLSHNNFVLPETRFSGAFLLISDHLFRFLLYAPLLLPLWYYIFFVKPENKINKTNKASKQSKENEASKTKKINKEKNTPLARAQGKAFYQRFAEGLALVWRHKASRNFTILLILCFLLNFPASYFMLDGSLSFRDLWQLWVIYGLSVPSSFFFFVLSLVAAFLTKDCQANEGTAQTPSSTKALSTKYRSLPEILDLQTAIVLLSALYLLRLVFSGPALPRLEDEVAYYVQALIFTSKQLRAALNLQGLPVSVQAAYKEALQIPYIFVKDGFFYSVHQHGYSMLLSIFGPLKGYLNYGLLAISLFLFYVLSRVAGLSESLRPWALLFFGSAPVLFFESNSYMAHPLALVLSLWITILYFAPADFSFFSISGPSAQGNLAALATQMRRQARILFLRAGLIFLLGNALAFVRLQTALPLFFALLAYEIFFFFASFFPASKSKEPASQSSGLAFAGRPALKILLFFAVAASSFLLLSRYAKLFDSQSILFTGDYFLHIFGSPCQSIGFGEGHGCFPTLGTLGYSFRKFVLRLFEYASTVNQELNAFGLPLGALIVFLLFCFAWRTLRDLPLECNRKEICSLTKKLSLNFTSKNPTPSIFVFFSILVFLHIGLFSLYFHNGGESFRGRYLLEIAPYLYLIFFLLLEGETRQNNAFFFGVPLARFYVKKTPAFLAIFLLLFANQFLRTRGGYFHAEFLPVRHAIDPQGRAIQNSLLTIEEKLPFVASHPEKYERKNATKSKKDSRFEREGPSPSYALFADEFGNEKKRLSKRQIRAAFQNGFGSLLCRAKKIGPRGFFWDKQHNLLTGPLPDDKALSLQKALGLRQAFRLQFHKPKFLLNKRRLKILQLARYHFHSLVPSSTPNKIDK